MKWKLFIVFFLVLVVSVSATAQDAEDSSIDSGVLNLNDLSVNLISDGVYNVTLEFENRFSLAENFLADVQIGLDLIGKDKTYYAYLTDDKIDAGVVKAYDFVYANITENMEDISFNITVTSTLGGKNYKRNIFVPFDFVEVIFDEAYESSDLSAQDYSTAALPCNPSYCASGYTDNGVSCSNGVCTRSCDKISCDSDWGSSKFYDDVELEDDDGSISAETGSYYISTSDNYCWRFKLNARTLVWYAPLNSDISSYAKAKLLGDGSTLYSESVCFEDSLSSEIENEYVYCYPDCNEAKDDDEICDCFGKDASLKAYGKSYENDNGCSGSYAKNPPFGDTNVNGWINIYRSYTTDESSDNQCTYSVQCSPSDTCCDEYGRFRSSSYKCQDNVQVASYGCPWGAGEGSDVGKQYYDRYCSGSSGSCNGQLINDNIWVLHSSCSDLQMCVDGNSVCANVDCFNDQDCPVDSPYGSIFCKNNDEYQKYKTWTCYNPGTTSSYCGSQYVDEFQTDCGETLTGTYGPEQCSSEDGDVVRIREDLIKGCSGSACITPYYNPFELVVQTCPYFCESANCVTPQCFSDGGCPSDEWYGDTFCNNGDVWQNLRDHYCQYPATINAQCSYIVTSDQKEPCPFGCVDGQCDPNGPPSIVGARFSPSNVRRSTSFWAYCDVSDPNGVSDIVERTIGFRHGNEPFTFYSSGFAGSGTTGYTQSHIPIPVDAFLGNDYDFYCKVVDSKGKGASKIFSNAITVIDYPTEFNIEVADHTTLTSPAIAGEKINFTTNLVDPDSQVKLLICDENGISGTSCVAKMYCSDGFDNEGDFNCLYDTSSDPSGEYLWTSFAINDLGDVVVGNTGEFYVIDAPLDLELTLDMADLWNYDGFFSGTYVIDDFNSVLETALANCVADQSGFCTLPINAHSSSAGFLELSELRIEYYHADNLAPQLFTMDNITVNEGDLVTITPQAYDYNGDNITYTISEPVGNDGVWQTTEFDDGEYNITITASDGSLTDETTILLKVLELIDPGVGGTIEYGDVTMIIPAGALPPDQFTDVQIHELDETDYLKENGLKVIGKIYQFSPSGMIFDPPIRVEMEYDESEVENESNMDAFLYKLIDPIDNVYKWVPLGAEVYPDDDVIVFYLTHFSEYAIHEVVEDIDPPVITVNFPRPIVYDGLTGMEKLNITVYDDKDTSPLVEVYMDNLLINVSEFVFADLDYGFHELNVFAKDWLNNSANASVEFIIQDIEAPNSSADVDSDWSNEDVLVELEVSEDVMETYYCVDQYDTCMPDVAGTSVLINESGINYVRFYSTDGENDENIQSVSVKVDKELPHTIVEGLPNGTSFNLNENTTVKVIPYDEHSGIDFFLGFFDSEFVDNEFEFEINSEGHHVLNYKSRDFAGNSEDQVNVDIYFDSIPPITTRVPEDVWLGKEYATIDFECESDGYAQCKNIFVKDKIGDVVMILDGLNISMDLLYDEGDITEHTLTYSSVDDFGNEEESHTVTVSVDDVKPNLTINYPLDGNSYYTDEIIYFNYTVSDVGSGLNLTEVYVNEDKILSNNISASSLMLGQNSISFIAVDNVGNVETIVYWITLSPRCIVDDDCYKEPWQNDTRCIYGDVYDNYVTYTCENPNSANSRCVPSSELKLLNECAVGCDSGECVDYNVIDEFKGGDKVVSFNLNGFNDKKVEIKIPKYAVVQESSVRVQPMPCEPGVCAEQGAALDLYCGDDSCTRECMKTDCLEEWDEVYSVTGNWSEHNINKQLTGFGRQLASYQNFSYDSCYKVNTWSDTDVVASSSIVGFEDINNFDSVLGLSWTLRTEDTFSYYKQSWGGPCFTGDDGSLMDWRDHYLTDDSDPGNGFYYADNIGGDWTGFCSKTCNDFLLYKCTKDCYNSIWSFMVRGRSDVTENYEDHDPSDEYGACNAEDGNDPLNPKIDHINFDPSKVYGMNVFKSPQRPYDFEKISCECDDCDAELLNPSLSLSSGLIWSHAGEFEEAVYVNDFSSELQAALDDCEMDDQGMCVVELSAGADSPGVLALSDLRIKYDLEYVCYSDADCSANTTMNRRCNGSEILEDFVTYSCLNPGTYNAVCTNVSTATFVEDCDNGVYCDGLEVCSSGSCVDGDPVDCSMNDYAEVAMCVNDPDNNPFTMDYFAGFTSVCDEEVDACTQVELEFMHECNVDDCGADCAVDGDCEVTDCDSMDGCVGSNYYDYENVGNVCLDDCTCTDNDCGDPLVTENDPRCVECVTDADCNNLDLDYCDSSVIKHDEGKCAGNVCVVETALVKDCDDKDENYCQGDILVTTDFYCSNAQCLATGDSMVCEHGCTDGACEDDPCIGVVCNDYCNGTSYFSNGECSEGVCEYHMEEQSSSQCGYVEPACNSDSDCELDETSMRCSASKLYQDLVEYTCENPGTENSACVASASQIFVEDCDDKDADYCEGSSLVHDNYFCFNGGCVLIDAAEECEFGCSDGACLGDPCAGVQCYDYCDGFTRYEDGQCVEGECEYSLSLSNYLGCGWVDNTACVSGGEVSTELVTASPKVGEPINIRVRNCDSDHKIDSLKLSRVVDGQQIEKQYHYGCDGNECVHDFTVFHSEPGVYQYIGFGRNVVNQIVAKSLEIEVES